MGAEPKKPDRLSALMGRFRAKVLIQNESENFSFDIEQKKSSCLTLAAFGDLTEQFISYADINAKGVAENDRFLVFCRCKDGTLPKPVADNFTLVAANALILSNGLEQIVSVMPSIMAINLKQSVELGAFCTKLSQEIHARRHGFNVVVESLCEIVLIRLLRMAIETGGTEPGMCADLGYYNVCLALTAMHKHPEINWKIEDLALKSGMSRTAFANKFKEVVGETPGEYLRKRRRD